MRARVEGSISENTRFGTWNYCYVNPATGKRTSKKIGSFAELPSREDAEKKAVALGYRLRFEKPPVPKVAALVEAYRNEKMPKRMSTRRVYELWLKKYVLPRWGKCSITELQPRPVELWLESLPLAPKTRGHLRGLLHSIWKYAMWSSSTPVQVNPISLVTVRGSSKRRKDPRNLDAVQFHQLMAHLREPFRTMATLQLCFGLRASELLGLRWSDVDWLGSKITIARGIVNQNIDAVKTRESHKEMNLDSRVSSILLSWKRASQFSAEDDWIFASPIQHGKLPYSYTGFWRKLKAACADSGVGHIATHSFRHTYRTWLSDGATPLDVQQKLMRHADIRTTMQYGNTSASGAELALSKVAGLALN